MKEFMLKNINVVNWDEIYEANVLIQEGKITEIYRNTHSNTEYPYMDMKGKYLLPGLIDSHVHLREPGLEHKEEIKTGTLAALAGGVTYVIDMPNTNPQTDSIVELNKKKKLFEKKSKTLFSLHFLGTETNLHELQKLNEGDVASIKIFMAGHHTAKNIVKDERILTKIMQIARQKNIKITVHAEDAELIDAQSEKSIEDYTFKRSGNVAGSAIKKLIRLCKKTKCSLHILHVSSIEEVKLIEDAKNRGLPITYEFIPPHLYYTYQDMYKIGNFIKLSPPLRTAADQEFLIKYLLNKKVDCIGSDHAPHSIEEKKRNFTDAPPGMPGVQEMLSVIYTLLIKRGLSVQESLKLCTYYLAFKPSEIFNIKGKGYIENNMDADFFIFDPGFECKGLQVMYTKNKWSAYENEIIMGSVEKTYINGELVYEKVPSMQTS